MVLISGTYLIEGLLHQRDVIIWKDENAIIQHAAYYMGEELYFYKHVQMMFNPWKILSKEPLYKECEHIQIGKYRQFN